MPLDAAAFAGRGRTDVWDDPTLEQVADFIVFTRGDAPGGLAGCPAGRVV